MSDEYRHADNYNLLKRELEEIERVLINTRNIAAEKAQEWKAKIASLEAQLAGREPPPATKAMLEFFADKRALTGELVFLRGNIEWFLVEWGWTREEAPHAPN